VVSTHYVNSSKIHAVNQQAMRKEGILQPILTDPPPGVTSVSGHWVCSTLVQGCLYGGWVMVCYVIIE